MGSLCTASQGGLTCIPGWVNRRARPWVPGQEHGRQKDGRAKAPGQEGPRAGGVRRDGVYGAPGARRRPRRSLQE